MVRAHSNAASPHADGPRERALALLAGRGPEYTELPLAAVERAADLARELGDDGALVDEGLAAAEILLGLGLDAEAIAAAVVPQRCCTSIAHARVAPRSCASLMPAVHSGYSFHSSVVHSTRSICAGSIPARATASCAARRAMALV